jgi:hypothetical protein
MCGRAGGRSFDALHDRFAHAKFSLFKMADARLDMPSESLRNAHRVAQAGS